MKVKSFAKVNLNLKVEPVDSHGLHKINSIITLVNDFFDVIKIKKTKNQQDIIKCNYKELEKNNFIFLVLDHLRKVGEIKEFYKIKLKKKIPLGSGLGGGTSNAVCVYLQLVKNRTKKLDQEIARLIGHDSYFFLSGFITAEVSGYGEKIKPFLEQIIRKKELILTGVVCETQKVYQKFDEVGFNHKDQNQLTKAALTLYPQLKKFSKLGVMSGSGSTFIKKTLNNN